MDDHEKIRKLRALRGFKQETMADRLGITTKAYSKLESGQTALTIPRLRQIAEILEIALSEILAFSEENIYRSCQQCVYQQLSGLAEGAFLTEQVQLRQRVEQLEAQLFRYQEET